MAATDRNRVSIDAIDARLLNVEQAHQDLMAAIGRVDQKIDKQNDALARQIADATKKDPTKWTQIITAFVGVVGIGVAVTTSIGWLAMAPTAARVSSISDDLKAFEQRYATVAYVADNLSLIRTRVGLIEEDARGKISVREHEAFVAHIEDKSSTLQKEIDGRFSDVVNRLDAMSVRINQDRKP